MFNFNFEKKEDSDLVCGYLDKNNKFYTNKEDRDKSNSYIEFMIMENKTIKEIRNIFRRYVVSQYNLENILTILSDSDVIKVSEILLNYHKEKEKYDNK